MIIRQQAQRMRGCRPASCRRERGFTIIELITAMVIFSMIVAAIFTTYMAVMNGAMAANRAAATAQRSRVALRTLEEALGATQSFTADSQYYVFDAENGTEPYLSFVASLSPSFPRSGRFPGFNIRRVTFAVEPGPVWGKRLVVRQNPILVDLTEEEQSYPLVLANDVRKFEMQFWDRKKTDWLDEWTDTNQLPQMVKFTVQFGGGDSQSPAGDEITRIVALPSVAVQPQWQAPGAIGLNQIGGMNGGGGIGGGSRIPGLPGQSGQQ
jgi:prepilin-type N-terminal cleavage/methylation domain-containing protein